MKRKLLLTAILVFTLSMVTACGVSDNDSMENQQENTSGEPFGSETNSGDGSTLGNEGNTMNNNTDYNNNNATDHTNSSATENSTGTDSHNIITGTISELEDLMFTLTDHNNKPYGFHFDKNNIPEGYTDFKNGDRVKVTYSGTFNADETFDGKILSIERAEEN